ncbi:hypothetical protein ELS24_09020 [Achromobacter spanius]|uniref:hypothetical protein n=1 Tax=Achromobacter spanius TaxID=217203 RepID=UPI000F8FA22E|nr:hypothetical protein [Achromobacter spanius]AZS78569.1 hypothetical protein ELS24_09020 [Achromobacter spanius]
MNNDKARQRMLKLLALARRGEGGERDNAQRFLASLLEKHGMSLADLEDEGLPTEWMKFPLKTVQDRRLLVQVASMVLKSNEVQSRQYRRETALWLLVTKPQYLEIELHYRAFKKDLKKALELAFIAFINRNDIFSGERAEEGAPCKYSTEDLAAVAAMAAGMPRTSVRRELGYAAGAAQ